MPYEGAVMLFDFNIIRYLWTEKSILLGGPARIPTNEVLTEATYPASIGVGKCYFIAAQIDPWAVVI